MIAYLSYRHLRSLDARDESGGDAAVVALREASPRGELTTEEDEERHTRLTVSAVDDGVE